MTPIISVTLLTLFSSRNCVQCVVIAIGAVLAFLSRNLPNVLNESHYIFLAIYNVCFFTAIVLPVSAILYEVSFLSVY